MKILFQDTETYSETPINHGTYRYAENAEVMIFVYAEDDGEVQLVDLTAGEQIPQHIIDAQEDPSITKVYHNAMFDLTVTRYALGWNPAKEQVQDTMARAMAHSLPGSLANLCDIMGVEADDAKDKRGKDLIKRFCKPNPKNYKVRRYTRETHPEEWEEFKEYARSDIKAMRSLYYKLPNWNYQGFEKELWDLDQRINDRGFHVDLELANQAIEAINAAQKRLAREVSQHTDGFVDRATQRDKMLEYICEAYGITLPDLTKSTIERRLNDPNLPPEAKDLLAIRQEASMASTSKYKALLRSVNEDGRLRGTMQYCGALRTGRWAGRTFQPQNLFRPTMKADNIEAGIACIKQGIAPYMFDNVMEMCANALRGAIIASPGHSLYVSDLSNIEGRVAAWLAGEEWKLEAFSEFDQGIGHDLYKIAYARAFDVRAEDVEGHQRQIGKVMELMLQYGGGVGAFLTGAASYRIDLDEMAKTTLPVVPQRIKDKATKFYDFFINKGMMTYGLLRDTFIACDSLKRMWREAHPEITSIWGELEDVFEQAIHQPGHTIELRNIRVRKDGAWLKIQMPSGRLLCYPDPKVTTKAGRRTLSYMGVNGYTRKWQRINTYGGKLFENLCQAGARDVMAWNMPIVEKAGFNILLSVHDELITEASKEAGLTDEHLSNLLSTNPAWAGGLPLAAGGFTSERYRKD